MLSPILFEHTDTDRARDPNKRRGYSEGGGSLKTIKTVKTVNTIQNARGFIENNRVRVNAS